MDWLVSTLGGSGNPQNRQGGVADTPAVLHLDRTAISIQGGSTPSQQDHHGGNASYVSSRQYRLPFERYPQIASELEEALVSEAAKQPHHDLAAAQNLLRKWIASLVRPAEDLAASAVSHQLLGIVSKKNNQIDDAGSSPSGSASSYRALQLHLAQQLIDQPAFAIHDKLQPKKIFSFRQILLRTQAIEFLFSHIAGLDAERTAVAGAASGSGAGALSGAGTARLSPPPPPGPNGMSTTSGITVKKLSATPASSTSSSVFAPAARAVQLKAPPKPPLGDMVSPTADVASFSSTGAAVITSTDATDGGFFVPTPTRRSPTDEQKAEVPTRSADAGPVEVGPAGEKIHATATAQAQQMQKQTGNPSAWSPGRDRRSDIFGDSANSSNPFGDSVLSSTSAAGSSSTGSRDRRRTYSEEDDLHSSGNIKNHPRSAETLKEGVPARPSSSSPFEDDTTESTTTAASSMTVAAPDREKEAVNLEAQLLVQEDHFPAVLEQKSSNYPPEFLQTCLEFFELTLRTNRLNGVLLEALQQTKQAVQVLSWLKDSEQDHLGVIDFSAAFAVELQGGNKGAAGGAPAGGTGQTCTLLRQRDAPLVEKEIKTLEMRLSEICSSVGSNVNQDGSPQKLLSSSAVAGGSRGRSYSGDQYNSENLPNASSRYYHQKGGSSSSTNPAAITNGSSGNYSGGGGSTSSNVKSNGSSTAGSSSSQFPELSGPGSVQIQNLPQYMNLVSGDDQSPGLFSRTRSSGIFFSSTLLNADDRSKNSVIHREYGVEDTTFALLVRDLVLPLLEQTVTDQKDLRNAERAQTVSRKLLLQRRLHEDNWVTKLAACARSVEQLLLLLTMVLKLQARTENVRKKGKAAVVESSSMVESLTKNMAETDAIVKKLSLSQADLERRRKEVVNDIHDQGTAAIAKLDELRTQRIQLDSEKKQLLQRLEEIDLKLAFLDTEEKSLALQVSKQSGQENYIAQSFTQQIDEAMEKLIAKTDQKMVQCNLLALVHQAKDHFSHVHGSDLEGLKNRIAVKRRQLYRQLVQFLDFTTKELFPAAAQISQARGGEELLGLSANKTVSQKFVAATVDKVFAQVTAVLGQVGLAEKVAVTTGAVQLEGINLTSRHQAGSTPKEVNLQPDHVDYEVDKDINKAASILVPPPARTTPTGTGGTKANAILAWNDDDSSASEPASPAEQIVQHHARQDNSSSNSCSTPVLREDPVRKSLRHHLYQDSGFLQELFTKLREKTDNHKCADCTRMDSSVSWASLTHGVFLCLNCAGVHRSLGVHTSFVRSITMDKWSWQDLARMVCAAKLQVATGPGRASTGSAAAFSTTMLRSGGPTTEDEDEQSVDAFLQDVIAAASENYTADQENTKGAKALKRFGIALSALSSSNKGTNSYLQSSSADVGTTASENLPNKPTSKTLGKKYTSIRATFLRRLLDLLQADFIDKHHRAPAAPGGQHQHATVDHHALSTEFWKAQVRAIPAPEDAVQVKQELLRELACRPDPLDLQEIALSILDQVAESDHEGAEQLLLATERLATESANQETETGWEEVLTALAAFRSAAGGGAG
ncbi:unnamed protein product [Amoebophrya sp. A120]|nr:unnamed protein product [Amoebophrya sp. A120]|eukprot:GSA120T00021474001.1